MNKFFEFGKILVSALIIFPPAGQTQTRNELGKPVISVWRSKDYNAEASNWAIVQDDRGVMYFGNTGGVLEYDGVSWRLIQFPNKSICRSLAKDASGRVYAGGVGDFGYLAPDSLGQMRFVSLLPQIKAEARDFADVWGTMVLRESIFFVTENFLFRWTPAASSQKAAPAGEMKIWRPANTFHLGFVVDEALFIRERQKGLMHLQGDSLRLVPGGERFADERIYVMLPFPAVQADSGAGAKAALKPEQTTRHAGARVHETTARIELRHPILIGTRTHGFLLYDGRFFTPFKTEADQYLLEHAVYSQGVALRNGDYLFNTLSGGVVLLQRGGKLLQILDRKSGLPDNTVYFAYSNPAHPETEWLAFDNGIARVEATGPASFFSSEHGIASAVRKITRHHGVLYVATNVGAYYLDGAAATFQPTTIPAEQTWDWLAFENRLLAASNYGVYRVDRSEAKMIRASYDNDFSATKFLRSKQDSLRVFVGINGIAALRWENGVWRDEGRAPGVQDEIRTLIETEDGTLWAGTYASGALRFTFSRQNKSLWENVRLERFGAAQGLPLGWVGVYEVNGKTVFCSSENMYCFVEETQRFVQDSTFMATPPQPGWVIKEDEKGRVWVIGKNVAMGTRGVDGRYQWLSAPFQRFSSELLETVYPENNGVIWFGGNGGLIRYDSNVEINYAAGYPALIRRVVVGRDSVIFGGAETPQQSASILRYVDNNPRFAYSASSYEDHTRVQFQTRLEGFEENWSNWNNKTEKEYTNLPEGDYHFRVRAKNIFQNVSREAVYHFSILPPWYRSWWAYGGYVLMLGLLVFAVDRVQRRRLLKRERRQAEFREAKLRAEAAELQAKILAAENERKTQELEAARQLQLSMLPKTVPQLPHLDIAVYMQTAGEVGGDYYDFKLHEDGTLTAAIGHATGHGLRAGTMVSATKSLFNALADEPEPVYILKKATKALKAMGFRELFMALTVAKFKGPRVQIAAAGMPFALLYRIDTNHVEEIVLKGMPLGSFTDFQYQQKELELRPGDAIFFMSDGFLEMFNPLGDVLGEESAKNLFAETAHLTPEQIIAHLCEKGKAWAAGRAQQDDVTFVVIKVK